MLKSWHAARPPSGGRGTLRRSFVLLALAATLALSGLWQLTHARSAASGCACGGAPCVGTLTIGSGKAGSLTFYVDDRGGAIGVYQESNGIDGLQGGGASPILPNDDQVCSDPSAYGPDQRVI